MRRSQLQKIPSNELVDYFVEIGLAQSEALDMRDIRRYNRLFSKETIVVNILRSREGDQRRLLFRLFDHKNYQVRVNAANVTYPMDPAKVRPVFEQIAASGWQPQAGSAGMTLYSIDNGLASKDYLSDAWLPEN